MHCAFLQSTQSRASQAVRVNMRELARSCYRFGAHAKSHGSIGRVVLCHGYPLGFVCSWGDGGGCMRGWRGVRADPRIGRRGP